MVYSTPNFSTNGSIGIEETASYISGQVPSFAPYLIFFLFLAIAGSGYFSEKRARGKSNIFMWSTVAGTITTISSSVLLFYENIINIEIVIILLAVTIASILLYLISDKDD